MNLQLLKEILSYRLRDSKAGWKNLKSDLAKLEAHARIKTLEEILNLLR